jgi:hypothetical protein
MSCSLPLLHYLPLFLFIIKILSISDIIVTINTYQKTYIFIINTYVVIFVFPRGRNRITEAKGNEKEISWNFYYDAFDRDNID